MTRRNGWARLATLALLATAGACAFVSGGSSKKKAQGPTEVENLVAAIERVYVDTEVTRDTVRSAMAALKALASADFANDAVPAYAAYLEVVDRSEKQAQALRGSVQPMKRAAGPVFARWEEDLHAFTSAEMRIRSQNRLEETRSRYEAIVAAVDPAERGFDDFNRGLRDHALFLSHDFNPTSLAEIQEGVKGLERLAADLDRRLDLTLRTTRVYIDAAALPSSARPNTVPVAGDSPADQPRPSARRTRTESQQDQGGSE
ncbi:MAG: DUF2959 family protein [Planctomycetaceae bacterium]